MFTIVETNALVKNINPRTENHGDDPVLACDVSLEFTASNKLLMQMDPKLLACLYQKEAANADEEVQDRLELDEEDFLPHRKFPLLGVIPWHYEGAGYTFQLMDERLSGTEITQVKDCKVNNFKVECKDGGTVILTVRVQGYPTEETIGDLCHFIKSEVPVSLLPPEKPQQMGMVDDEVEEEAA